MTIREKIVLSLFDIADTKMLQEIAEFIVTIKQENNQSQPIKASSTPANPSKENFYKAFGSWEGKESAEDLIDTIRNSRLFNRQIESLWNDQIKGLLSKANTNLLTTEQEELQLYLLSLTI